MSTLAVDSPLSLHLQKSSGCGGKKLREVDGLVRAERRFLNQLNKGGVPATQISRSHIDNLVESGFVEEGINGKLTITVHGQLALARERFRNLAKPKVVVVPSVKRQSLWHKLVRQVDNS